MIIDSGHVALARQQHTHAVNNFESHNDELKQLRVIFNNFVTKTK